MDKSKKSIDQEMPFLKRKQTGSFYTANDLTIVLMNELIQSLPSQKKDILYELKFLEPCVGEGSFVFAYLMVAQDRKSVV